MAKLKCSLFDTLLYLTCGTIVRKCPWALKWNNPTSRLTFSTIERIQKVIMQYVYRDREASQYYCLCFVGSVMISIVLYYGTVQYVMISGWSGYDAHLLRRSSNIQPPHLNIIHVTTHYDKDAHHPPSPLSRLLENHTGAFSSSLGVYRVYCKPLAFYLNARSALSNQGVLLTPQHYSTVSVLFSCRRLDFWFGRLLDEIVVCGGLTTTPIIVFLLCFDTWFSFLPSAPLLIWIIAFVQNSRVGAS